MEEITAVDIIATFLDEHGYRFLHSTANKNWGPTPGEFFLLNQTVVHLKGGLTHMQIMCQHCRWDLCLAIYNTGEVIINVDNNYAAISFVDAPLPPIQKAIHLANPKSLDILKRLL